MSVVDELKRCQHTAAEMQRLFDDNISDVIAHTEWAATEIASNVETLTPQVQTMKALANELTTHPAISETISSHGECLAECSLAIMSSIQFQDVVRQRLERLQSASDQRDAMIADIVKALAEGDGVDKFVELRKRMESLSEDYAAEEKRHTSSLKLTARPNGAAEALELF